MKEIANDHPALVHAARLGKRLLEAEEVRRFRLAEEQIQRSNRVNKLIEEIKRKQKELVHAKHYGKSAYIRQLEQELDQLHKEMDSLPIVREYQQSQVEMNDLLQTLTNIVAQEISEKLDVEIGGDAGGGGCGSGGPCGCK
ncbi:RicAFT regulatory complex protein RicA family protein [Melghirimyces algeriensis]|uniref:Cell fate regulator YmcA, YheA/YmcA/DUF963 family (Controls sporulation, competence, biofilm development) n=1 Tax=Melghirimyces algeriensis TaxID=910412 RepID=A0A521CAZ7_9BACL|nr:YlbF family regulator [Melghirimyces algeriensis]SMO55981.1 Cell fate regulator YmcA, YheA/YmcA/DUF963 family (controls sporulation, competence, biofilm development) [Melghirimyces algeriensis]